MLQKNIAHVGKYDGPGKGLASRACNWYINTRPGFRVSMDFDTFSVEGDPPCMYPSENIKKL